MQQPIVFSILLLVASVAFARTVLRLARERGVLVGSAYGTRIRAVTHLDVSREDCEKTVEALRIAVA